MLNKDEIHTILELIREKHGPGYASDSKIAALQGKLSVMLQMAPAAPTEVVSDGTGWYQDAKDIWHYVKDKRVVCGNVFRWRDTGVDPVEKLSVDSGGHACVDCLTVVTQKMPEVITNE